MTTHNTHREKRRGGEQAKCQCQCQGNQENLLRQMARQIRKEESQVFARADDDDVDGVAQHTHTHTHTHNQHTHNKPHRNHKYVSTQRFSPWACLGFPLVAFKLQQQQQKPQNATKDRPRLCFLVLSNDHNLYACACVCLFVCVCSLTIFSIPTKVMTQSWIYCAL